MKKIRNKIVAIAISLFFIFSMAASTVLIPSVIAHSPPINIITYAYINAYPSTQGVGQPIVLFGWLDKLPPTANGQYGDRWTNLNITVTLPDGSAKTLGPFTSDPVGTIQESYIPTTVGKYTFQFNFPGHVITFSPNGVNPTQSLALGTVTGQVYANDTFLPSQSNIASVNVLSTPVPLTSNYPMPTEYWSTPVSQARHLVNWEYITGDWLGTSAIFANINDYCSPPQTAHIEWTKPIAFGGVAGLGSSINIGDAYYSYQTYEALFSPAIIMNGHLYYNNMIYPRYGFYCIDLATGQQIWYNNGSATMLPGLTSVGNPQLSFGQEYNYQSPNQAGIVDYLWSTYTMTNGSSAWDMYDAVTGNLICTIVNVPAAAGAFAASALLIESDGNYDIYTLNANAGTLSVWNESQTILNTRVSVNTLNGYWEWRPPVATQVPASLGTTVYNISGVLPPGGTRDTLMFMDAADQLAIYGNVTSSLGQATIPTPTGYNMFAISINPLTIGQVAWKQTYPWPQGNITFDLETNALGSGVFAIFQKETRIWQAFSTTTGNQLWTSQTPETANHMYGVSAEIYNGVLYSGDSAGTGGVIYAYTATTGTLLWSVQSPAMNDTGYWPYIPMQIAAFASGDLIWTHAEHSPTATLETGMLMGSMNATTGAPIWNITFWDGGAVGGVVYVAEDYLVALNAYDNQIYAFSKGPTATTVETPLASISQGQSVVIQGTVMDISPGTKQSQIALRFPDGVPAVSDDSETPWMEYVYMQNPRPTNTNGVQVSIDAVDPNGNHVHLGSATTDSNGFYSLLVNQSALVPGKYTVTASFAGSNAYWQSASESAFAVIPTSAAAASVTTPTPLIVPSPTPTSSSSPSTPGLTSSPTIAPTPSPATVPPASSTPTATFIAIGVAVIIIIVVAAALILRRRK